MQAMTIYISDGGKWETITPNLRTVTAKELMAFEGQDVMVHWQDTHRTIYAYGNAKMKQVLQQKYPAELLCMMDMDSFGYYWQYKLLELGVDTFTRVEDREVWPGDF